MGKPGPGKTTVSFYTDKKAVTALKKKLDGRSVSKFLAGIIEKYLEKDLKKLGK